MIQLASTSTATQVHKNVGLSMQGINMAIRGSKEAKEGTLQ